jgi:hypothetical protein
MGGLLTRSTGVVAPADGGLGLGDGVLGDVRPPAPPTVGDGAPNAITYSVGSGVVRVRVTGRGGGDVVCLGDYRLTVERY